VNTLRQISIIAQVVETGSVLAAADKLDLSKSVVSQHLKALENELGVVLLKRTTRRQTLTTVGSEFYQSCKDMNQIVDSAWEVAGRYQAEPQGKLKICAPTALMDILVAPAIAELLTLYPKIRPELVSEDLHSNLMDENIDLSIRVGNSPDSNLRQKKIGSFRDVLCISSDKQVDDIMNVPYIANAWQGHEINHQFTAHDKSTFVYQKQASCSANSFYSCLSLIKSGVGVGIIPDFYLPQLKNELKNAMPDYKLPSNPIYALTPFTLHTPLAIQELILLLEKSLTDELK